MNVSTANAPAETRRLTKDRTSWAVRVGPSTSKQKRDQELLSELVLKYHPPHVLFFWSALTLKQTLLSWKVQQWNYLNLNYNKDNIKDTIFHFLTESLAKRVH